MAKRGTIKWNRPAFEEVRRSHEVNDALADLVNDVTAKLPLGHDHYVSGVEPGATRSRGFVVTASPEAMVAEAEGHSLLRALGGGTGYGVYTTKSGKSRIATQAQAEAWGGKFEAF